MLDELKEEQIVNKVGGRFKLSTLIQKRMIALNQGARPLVDLRGADKMTIVIQEIMQDKIYLDLIGQPPDERADRGGRKGGRSTLPSRQNSCVRAPVPRFRRRSAKARRSRAADHKRTGPGSGSRPRAGRRPQARGSWMAPRLTDA